MPEASAKKAAAHRLDEIAIRVKLIDALANPRGAETDFEIDSLVADVLNLCEGREPAPDTLDRLVRMLKRAVDAGQALTDDNYAKEAQQHLVAMIEDTLLHREADDAR